MDATVLYKVQGTDRAWQGREFGEACCTDRYSRINGALLDGTVLYSILGFQFDMNTSHIHTILYSRHHEHHGLRKKEWGSRPAAKEVKKLPKLEMIRPSDVREPSVKV